MLPKASIFIPTYNQEKYIEKAIASALAQDYENLEVVVSDDASDYDLSLVVCKYKDERLHYFRNEKNIGRVANYHKALYEYATGEWVLCLDGDDYLTDNYFVTDCIRSINDHENVVFIQAGHEIVNALTEKQTTHLPGINEKMVFLKGEEFFRNFPYYNHFSHLTSFYNREKAMSVGFYTEDILSTDIESFLKLSLEGNVVLIKKAVGAWVHHGANASNADIDIYLKNSVWIDRTRSYAASTHPSTQQFIKKWYKKLISSYFISLIAIVRSTPGKWSNAFKSMKHLVRYIFRKHPAVLINPRFIGRYIIASGSIFFKIFKHGNS